LIKGIWVLIDGFWLETEVRDMGLFLYPSRSSLGVTAVEEREA
jgi:hypothetical protein